ncbi:hypothetical protein JCM7447_10030 [Corynebacterium amycolatum]
MSLSFMRPIVPGMTCRWQDLGMRLSVGKGRAQRGGAGVGKRQMTTN